MLHAERRERRQQVGSRVVGSHASDEPRAATEPGDGGRGVRRAAPAMAFDAGPDVGVAVEWLDRVHDDVLDEIADAAHERHVTGVGRGHTCFLAGMPLYYPVCRSPSSIIRS
jgi:hypothetical protein